MDDFNQILIIIKRLLDIYLVIKRNKKDFANGKPAKSKDKK